MFSRLCSAVVARGRTKRRLGDHVRPQFDAPQLRRPEGADDLLNRAQAKAVDEPDHDAERRIFALPAEHITDGARGEAGAFGELSTGDLLASDEGVQPAPHDGLRFGAQHCPDSRSGHPGADPRRTRASVPNSAYVVQGSDRISGHSATGARE